MQITVRMPDVYLSKLESIAVKMGLKKSDVTRMAIKRFIEEYDKVDDTAPFAKIRQFVGIAESGISDLGQNHRKYLIAEIKRSTK